jgi:hypothetical protein
LIADNFGIAKVYATASGYLAQELYMNMQNARQRPLDHWPNTFERITSGVDSGYWYTGGDQVRISLWSADNKPWGNAEHSFYFKILSGDNSGQRATQPYIGGGRHSDSSRRCHGNSMKVSVFDDTHVQHRKEICHPQYCVDKTTSNGLYVIGPNRLANARNGQISGRWWGFKTVQILLPNQHGCRIECWVDEGADDGNGRLVIAGNQNRWRLFSRYDDLVTGTSNGGPTNSNWCLSESDWQVCQDCYDDHVDGRHLNPGFVSTEPFWVNEQDTEYSHSHANACVIRTDRNTHFALAYWSCREIDQNCRLIEP